MKYGIIVLLSTLASTPAWGDSPIAGRTGVEGGVGLFGVVPEAHLGLSYALTEDDVIALNLGGGALSTNGKQLHFDDFEATRYGLATFFSQVSYARTIWGSLYARGGLGFRGTLVNVHADSKAGDSNVEVGGGTSAFLLSAGVGNQWRWSNGLYLDVQWLGAGISFAKDTSLSLNGHEAVANVSQVRDFVADRTRLLARGEVVFTRVSLGYRF